jgi:hypothetical protein
MPNEDLLGPVDLATLLTSFKGSVPATFGAYHGDLNAGEDEKLRAMQGPANFYQQMGTAIPQRNYHPQSSYARQGQKILDWQDFKMRYPTPEMQRAVIESMNHYSGGGARKTVREMADELLKKGVKVSDKPDLTRRSLFGLGEITPPKDMPLAKFGEDPTVKHEITTVKPSANAPAVSHTIEQIAQTPLSRRSVLQSMAGHALRGMLPEGAIPTPDIGKAISDIIKPAASAIEPSYHYVPALMARAVANGMDIESAINYIENHPLVPKYEMGPDEVNDLHYMYDLPSMHDLYSDPGDYRLEENLIRPGDVMRDYLSVGREEPLSSMRPAIRALRAESPETYDALKTNARDISSLSVEDAFDQDLLRSQNEYDKWRVGDPRFMKKLINRE